MTGTGDRQAGRFIPGQDRPAGRWELLRALGSLTLGPPAETLPAARALGLPAWSAAEHTELFVLSLPPYASIHLGPDGKLGGEAADRIAGLWRALGLGPPADADHLGVILGLYAELGEAAAGARGERTRERLEHARETVLWEHLWPWVPGYLTAAATGPAACRPWSQLTARALTAEALASRPPPALPLALRTAPGPITADLSPGDLLDALTAPLRTGFVLTRADVGAAARRLGLGLRQGERRFAIKVMLEQDPAPTLGWLADHAGAWAGRHARQAAVAAAVAADPSPWWAGRAAGTADVLRRLAASAPARPDLQELLVPDATVRR